MQSSRTARPLPRPHVDVGPIPIPMLVELRELARTTLGRLPGSALLVFDSDLRLMVAEGPAAAREGWDEASAEGRLLADALAAASFAVAEPHCRAVAQGELRTFELAASDDETIYRARALPLDLEGEVVGGIALVHDATVDVRAEAAFAEIARRSHAFFEHAPIGMAVVDSGGVVLDVNRALSAMMGYEPGELLGQRVERFIHPDERERHGAAMRSFYASDEENCQLEGRYVDAQGRIRHLLTSVSVTRDLDGRAERLYVQAVDNTERVKTAASLEKRLTQQTVVALLGEVALSGIDPPHLIEEAVGAVAGTLGVEMATFVERAESDRGVVRAGVGLRDGAMGASIELDPPTAFDAPALARASLASGVTVAVGDPRDPHALLGAHSSTERAFGDDDRAFLKSIALVLHGAIERRAAEDRARHQALHDRVTGLPNRALFVDRLDQALARLARDGGNVAVVAIDIDDFRAVNESHGHAAGDAALAAIGARLRRSLEGTATVARFGGDEFLVLSEGIDDERRAEALAGTVAEAFDRPVGVGGEDYSLSATIGVALVGPDERPSAELVIRNAGIALDRARERGRGGYELFDEAVRSRMHARRGLERELRAALARDELCVYYQPYYRLSDGHIEGVEALVRWRHPERGLVAPDEFIPLAEESGLIVALGRWVLRRACCDLARWRATTPAARDLRLSVNVSSRQVDEPGLAATVAEVLSDTGIEPEALGLEVTERLFLHETDETRDALEGLRRFGVRLLLDDFGTGYSSLGYLRRFPMDVLKIDREFVTGLAAGTDSEETIAIVAAIVSMAEALGLGVIAEGVETEAEIDRLRVLGCTSAQGYYFAKPMPAPEVAELLATGS